MSSTRGHITYQLCCFCNQVAQDDGTDLLQTLGSCPTQIKAAHIDLAAVVMSSQLAEVRLQTCPGVAFLLLVMECVSLTVSTQQSPNAVEMAIGPAAS